MTFCTDVWVYSGFCEGKSFLRAVMRVSYSLCTVPRDAWLTALKLPATHISCVCVCVKERERKGGMEESL